MGRKTHGRTVPPPFRSFPMRKLFVLFAAAAALTTAACNTVEGVGEDTQAAGAAVSGAAREAGN